MPMPSASDALRSSASLEQQVRDLNESLNKMQIKMDQDATELTNLRAENARLQVLVDDRNKRTTASQGAANKKIGEVNSAVESAYGAISHFSQMFTIFYELRINEATITDVPADTSVLDPLSPARFHEHEKSNTVYFLGTTLEFFGALPVALASLHTQHKDHFIRAVLNFANSARSNSVHACKESRGEIFAHVLPPSIFNSDAVDDLKSSTIVRDLLRGTLPAFSTILYESEDSHEFGGLFKNQALIKIGQIILHTATSLRKTPADWFAATNTNYVNWGMRAPTPGFIAYTAILATYLISGDPKFVEVGTYSRINYSLRYRMYKETLVLNWESDIINEVRALFQPLFTFEDASDNESNSGGNMQINGLGERDQQAAIRDGFAARTTRTTSSNDGVSGITLPAHNARAMSSSSESNHSSLAQAMNTVTLSETVPEGSNVDSDVSAANTAASPPDAPVVVATPSSIPCDQPEDAALAPVRSTRAAAAASRGKVTTAKGRGKGKSSGRSGTGGRTDNEPSTSTENSGRTTRAGTRRTTRS